MITKYLLFGDEYPVCNSLLLKAIEFILQFNSSAWASTSGSDKIPSKARIVRLDYLKPNFDVFVFSNTLV